MTHSDDIDPPRTAAGLPAEADLERFYTVAKTIQTCGSRIQKDVKSGTLKAATYPVAGLEAVCASLGLALRPEDYLVSTYRNLGDVIAKGVPLRPVIAEIAGRATGVAKGKGGAMHIADSAYGLMTTTGIVGSGLPIATGLALSSLLAGDGRITAVTFGDGATSIGAFHEAMNLAAVWNLPILFMCQNNQWAEHTPTTLHMVDTQIAGKVRSYGMQSATVDGFDPLATLEVVLEAAESVRNGDGPYFVEAVSYRLGGHTSTADYAYMPKEDLDAARKAEPVGRLRELLEGSAALSSQRLEEIDSAALAEVEDAFTFAYASDYPDQREAYTDVFSTETMEISA
ncbi:thiamine pyrophosphate-dependent dehydrogenase E1 component subunit alpha [Nocardia sp. NPDC050378]|uniref:thiamine pyrophosphate-dependent dehydrogenase E1 component subunit alpha n=1 Tax=Nocardia sp. NPDC050378 TaxID=3155400 RepID=UPI0033C5A418